MFTHSDEMYYVRELGSLIDEDPGNLSRELRTLEEEGLFHSHTKGRIKFYSLNKTYPLYKELKKIVFKTEGVEGVLRDLVSRLNGIRFAFLYGSYAKNREKRTSDIDLILVGRSLPKSFLHDLRQLESRLNREINFTFYSEAEFEEAKEEEGGFLNLVLGNQIILLKGTADAGKGCSKDSKGKVKSGNRRQGSYR
jgi:predicted nucleotidyltransferase